MSEADLLTVLGCAFGLVLGRLLALLYLSHKDKVEDRKRRAAFQRDVVDRFDADLWERDKRWELERERQLRLWRERMTVDDDRSAR